MKSSFMAVRPGSVVAVFFAGFLAGDVANQIAAGEEPRFSVLCVLLIWLLLMVFCRDAKEGFENGTYSSRLLTWTRTR